MKHLVSLKKSMPLPFFICGNIRKWSNGVLLPGKVAIVCFVCMMHPFFSGKKDAFFNTNLGLYLAYK